MRTDFDILIVGGGMVGACAAALAAAEPAFAGLRIALLEAQPPSIPPPDNEVDLRVSAISRASERLLSAVGAWAQLDPRARCAYSDMHVWDAQDTEMGAGALRFSAANTGEPNLGYIIENRRIQWALYEAPLFRDRITILRGSLVALEFAPGGAYASLSDGRKIAVVLVVGADGADSASRSLAGLQVSQLDYVQSALVTHVRTERPHNYTARQRFLESGPIAFLPLHDGRCSIVWTTTPEHAQALVALSEEECASQITSAIDSVLGRVDVAAPRVAFPLRMLHANDYCRDGFVLIGDAAHAVHPLAGQGVNLGFLDAAALIEVLADELRTSGQIQCLGEKRVLRRYERWRKSENALALSLIDGLNRLFSNSQGLLKRVRRQGLGLVNQSQVMKRLLMGRAMGTSGELPRIARTGTLARTRV